MKGSKMAMQVHRIYAMNTGTWSPDELYGQSARPVYLGDADCRTELSRLNSSIVPGGAPDGLEYGSEAVDAADLTADEAAQLRPYNSAYAEWAEAEIERLTALVIEVARQRADKNKQTVAELIRPVLGDLAASRAYRGV